MSGHHDQIFIPKPVLAGMIALASFAIVSTGLARATQVGVTREAAGPTTRSVGFRFAMRGDSAIVATRIDGRRLTLARDHEEIFPRLILQGFQNIRVRDGVALDAPMALVVARDGQRLLVDPATRVTVRLAAFGSQNGAAFDALLA